MPTCNHCDTSYEAADLVRHESHGVTLVHCPDCACLMGRYRRHGDDPQTDTLRS